MMWGVGGAATEEMKTKIFRVRRSSSSWTVGSQFLQISTWLQSRFVRRQGCLRVLLPPFPHTNHETFVLIKVMVPTFEGE